MAQRVMDLTGRGDTSILRIEAVPAPELLVSLSAFALPADHATLESGPEWIEDVRTRASRELLRAIERIGPASGKTWANLVGLALRSPATPTVGDFLARVQALSPLDARLYLLGYHVPAYQGSISREVLRRAGEGDDRAIGLLVKDSCFYGGEAGQMLAPLLALSPEDTKDLMLEILSRWYDEVFRAREADLMQVLTRDAEAKRAMVGTVSSEDLIEAASGIQFVPQPGISQLYLIPQIAMRPWVLLCEHDDARLFCYPVADESMGGDRGAPPGRLVRLHRALGDEKRVRLLKAVATSTPTLAELVDQFDMPKSTLHHHMAILRTAGLIRVTSDQDRRYSVRFDVIPEASSMLDAYLRPGRGGGAAAAGAAARHQRGA
jgi:DNA-binding transcriptional ArsR family regulator